MTTTVTLRLGAMAALVAAAFFEMLSLWLQFDRSSFGRGGWGFDLIRDSFEVSPAEVIVRLRAAFELSILVGFGFLFFFRIPEEK